MEEDPLLGSYDVGKNILIPYLLSRGVRNLDFVIISHFDSDHVGGILYIMKEIKVKNVLISRIGQNESENFLEFVKIIKEKKINVIEVEAGNRVNIEKNIYFDVLWPYKDSNITENEINNNSIVCKFSYNNFSMLFTGDIEKEAEELILSKNTNLKADALKVAHHRFKNFNHRRIFKSSIS